MQPLKIANLKLFEHDPEEKIIGEARRHPIGIIVVIVNALIAIMILDLILYFVIRHQASIKDTFGFLEQVNISFWISVIVLIIAVLIVTGVAMSVYVYRRNYLVLTNEKIVLVHTFSLMKREISQLSIGDIQDVAVSQPTLMSRVFGYGTLTVETSGEQKNVWATYLSHPFERSSAIVSAHEADVKLHGN